MSYLCSDMHCSTLNMGIFMTHSDVILVGLLLTTASIHSCAKSNFAGSNGSPPPTKKSANSNTTTSTSTGGDPSAVSVEGGGTTGPSNCISGDFENKKYLICKGQKTKAESAVFAQRAVWARLSFAIWKRKETNICVCVFILIWDGIIFWLGMHLIIYFLF